MSWSLPPETALRPLFVLYRHFLLRSEWAGLSEVEILPRGGECQFEHRVPRAALETPIADTRGARLRQQDRRALRKTPIVPGAPRQRNRVGLCLVANCGQANPVHFASGFEPRFGLHLLRSRSPMLSRHVAIKVAFCSHFVELGLLRFSRIFRVTSNWT
jgi:hypothetical protein